VGRDTSENFGPAALIAVDFDRNDPVRRLNDTNREDDVVFFCFVKRCRKRFGAKRAKYRRHVSARNKRYAGRRI
jgi:hypothetical protein